MNEAVFEFNVPMISQNKCYTGGIGILVKRTFNSEANRKDLVSDFATKYLLFCLAIHKSNRIFSLTLGNCLEFIYFIWQNGIFKIPCSAF